MGGKEYEIKTTDDRSIPRPRDGHMHMCFALHTLGQPSHTRHTQNLDLGLGLCNAGIERVVTLFVNIALESNLLLKTLKTKGVFPSSENFHSIWPPEYVSLIGKTAPGSATQKSREVGKETLFSDNLRK